MSVEIDHSQGEFEAMNEKIRSYSDPVYSPLEETLQ